jgi:hypothetical protein
LLTISFLKIYFIATYFIYNINILENGERINLLPIGFIFKIILNGIGMKLVSNNLIKDI